MARVKQNRKVPDSQEHEKVRSFPKLYTSDKIDLIIQRAIEDEQKRLSQWLTNVWIPYTTSSEELQRALSAIFALGTMIGKVDPDILRDEMDNLNTILEERVESWELRAKGFAPDLPPDIPPIIDSINVLLNALTYFLNGPNNGGDNGEMLKQIIIQQQDIFAPLAAAKPIAYPGGREPDDSYFWLGNEMLKTYHLPETKTWENALRLVYRRLIQSEHNGILNSTQQAALAALDKRSDGLFRERGMLQKKLIDYASQAGRDAKKKARK